MATTGWSITHKEPSTAPDASIDSSTGVASFPANTSTETDNVYTIVYEDSHGCTANTEYTVKKQSPCQSAFTYTTVSGCLDWARHEVSSNDIVSAETESYTITGESKDCNGNYKEVTFSCAEGPNTLWTADITHTGTSYTAKVYRKMGVYTTYAGLPATLTNGQGEHYQFNVCTNKLTITANAYMVDQDGRKVSQWGSDNPTAYGVQVDTNGVPLDESAEFRFKIDTREAQTTSIHSCGSIGYIQQDATVVVTIAAGSKTASDTYPASAVAWMQSTSSGYRPCYPPYEYFTRHVAITETLTSQVETTKYIIKVNDGEY